jgi:hypothetical protein
MPTDTAALYRLLDLQDIQRALAIYVIALDSRELSLFDQCFTPDAEIALAGMGRMTPEGYRQMAEAGLGALDATQHHIGLPLINLDGDRADARCYFMAQHVRNALAPNPCLLIGGWYTDSLVRTGAGWRIARREGTALWYDGNPLVLGYDFPTGAVPRGPGHAAPSWLKA